jgi:hypothetical protein
MICSSKDDIFLMFPDGEKDTQYGRGPDLHPVVALAWVSW